MKRRPVFRAVALLLVICLLWPPVAARADRDPELLVLDYDVSAMFTDYETAVRVYYDADDHLPYVTAEGAAALTGLSLAGRTGTELTLRGQALTFTAGLADVSSRTDETSGETLYQLQELMNACDTYVIVRTGCLYVNSVPYNLDLLVTLAKDTLASPKYDADLLNNDFVTAGMYLIGNSYDIITNMRFNAFTGGAYKEDIHEVLMELVSVPDYDDSAALSGLDKVNDRIADLTEILLGPEGWDIDGALTELAEDALSVDARDFWTAVFGDGAWIMLEGPAAMLEIRSCLESVKTVTGADIADLLFSTRLGEVLQPAGEAIGVDLSENLSLFGLSDLISMTNKYTAALQLQLGLIEDLETVIETQEVMPEIWNVILSESGKERLAILGESADVISEYRAVLSANAGDIAREIAGDMGEVMAKNAVKSVGTALVLGSGKWALTLVKVIGDGVFKTDKKVKAIKTMVMYQQLQQMFRDCLEGAMKDPEPEDAKVILAGVRLYLSAVRHACEDLSTDKLKSLGVPMGLRYEMIDERRGEINAFCEGMFEVVDNPVPVSGTAEPPVIANADMYYIWSIEETAGGWKCEADAHNYYTVSEDDVRQLKPGDVFEIPEVGDCVVNSGGIEAGYVALRQDSSYRDFEIYQSDSGDWRIREVYWGDMAYEIGVTVIFIPFEAELYNCWQEPVASPWDLGQWELQEGAFDVRMTFVGGVVTRVDAVFHP